MSRESEARNQRCVGLERRSNEFLCSLGVNFAPFRSPRSLSLSSLVSLAHLLVNLNHDPRDNIHLAPVLERLEARHPPCHHPAWGAHFEEVAEEERPQEAEEDGEEEVEEGE